MDVSTVISVTFIGIIVLLLVRFVSGMYVIEKDKDHKKFKLRDAAGNVICKPSISARRNEVEVDFGYHISYKQISEFFEQIAQIYKNDLDWNNVRGLMLNGEAGVFSTEDETNRVFQLTKNEKDKYAVYTLNFTTRITPSWYIFPSAYVSKHKAINSIQLSPVNSQDVFAPVALKEPSPEPSDITIPTGFKNVALEKMHVIEWIEQEIVRLSNQFGNQDKTIELIKGDVFKLKSLIVLAINVLSDKKEYVQQDNVRQIFSVHIGHLEKPFKIYCDLKVKKSKNVLELEKDIKDILRILIHSLEDFLDGNEKDDVKNASDSISLIRSILDSDISPMK